MTCSSSPTMPGAAAAPAEPGQPGGICAGWQRPRVLMFLGPDIFGVTCIVLERHLQDQRSMVIWG